MSESGSEPGLGRRRGWAWTAGLLLLVAVAVALVALFRGGGSPRAALIVPAVPPAAPVPMTRLEPTIAERAMPKPGVRRVGGSVRLPNGQPCPGATVALYRAVSAWPEWRRERIDQPAITGADGSFQFDTDQRFDLLLGFEHPQWAGGLEEVPSLGDAVVLQLQPGFPLVGQVTNDVGTPLANVLVAVESVFSDQRRATSTVTASNGTYEFQNLPAGPVRIVARHPQWQPATMPAVVVGARGRVDLTFDRPALPPLRGRVLSAVGQTPIAGATVQVMPPNGKLGLVLPVTATSGEDGGFVLTGLARGTALVFVRHPDHGAVVRTLAIGGSSAELSFELPPRSILGGQLSLDGQSLPEWEGQVLLVRDSGGDLAAAVVDGTGRFEFQSKLSPGWAMLTLVRSEMAFQRSVAMDLQVRIEENARTTLDLPLVQAAVVRGKVQDEQGRPLAGVAVVQTRLLAENARWISDAATSLDVGAFGSQVVQLVGFDRDQSLAVTGADGAFVIRGQKPGPLLVRFDLAGRGSRLVRTVVPAAGATADLGILPMVPGGRIQGRVVRGETQLAGAVVSVVGKESQAMVVTRGDGSFVVEDLQPGEYRLRARLPSMPTATAETLVQVLASAAVQNLRLELPSGRTVRGVVNGSDGQPVPSALVTVTGAIGQPTITDAGGRFSLELPERAIELRVSLGDRSVRSPVRRGQQEVEVKLDTPPSATLVAQVYGLLGRKRPTGALLRLAVIEGGLVASIRTRWVDMQGGELRWPLCPVGRVEVQICCDGYAPWIAERDLLANEEHSLGEVLLEPGSSLFGRVVDPTGAAVANASVLLGEEADLDMFEPPVRTAADGTFRIRGVTTRSASLVVRAAGLAPRTVDLRLPQDVLALTPLVVQLEPGSTIEVEVSRSRSREGGLVQLRRQGREGRVLATAELDDRGRAEFQNRSPGRYTVQLYGSDEPPKAVRIERAGQRVPVRL